MTQLRFGVPQAFSSAQLRTFVQKLEPFSVHTATGLRLKGYKYEQAQAKAWLVVCAGRTEHSAIYHETLYDFALQGYNLLIYDHQGQGSSERLLPEAHIGHVQHFDDYVADLELILQTYVANSSLPVHLLAHSMGGAVALRHAQNFAPCYQAMALVAPMLGIQFPVPQFMALGLAKFWGALFGDSAWIPTGKAYAPKAFAKNLITQDAERYQVYVQSFADNPAAQLGEPSVRWVLEALAVCETLLADQKPLTVPCLLIQAGSEQIVANAAQNQYAAQQAQVTLLTLEQAAHQVLLAPDAIREPCLGAILAHFAAHS